MQFVFSDEQIEELRVICEGYFKQSYTPEEARVMALNLLELYECLCDLDHVSSHSIHQK